MLGRAGDSVPGRPGFASAEEETRAQPISNDSAKTALLWASLKTRTSYASPRPAARGSQGRVFWSSLRVAPAEARLAGADDGLGPVGATQLGEDPGDMVADRVGAQE